MRRNPVFLLVFMISAAGVCAPAAGAGWSGIDTVMISAFHNAFQSDPSRKVMQNALSSNDLNGLVQNRMHQGKVDHYFDVRLDIQSITDQKKSGRCWLFTTLNILRYPVMQTYRLKEFEFSENYCFFWDQLEKANLFLEGIIDTRRLDMDDRKVEWLFKNPVSDGGLWNLAVAVIRKYGLIPKEAMPESRHSENTSVMRRFLKRKLRQQGLTLRRMHASGASAGSLQEARIAMLQEIYIMLALHLGEPPRLFSWRAMDTDKRMIEFNDYTPLQFCKRMVQADLNNYLMFMHDPTRPFYGHYAIEMDRNVAETPDYHYVNLPLDSLKAMAKASLLAGEGLYFACDVNKQLNRDTGILSVHNYEYEGIYGVSLSMDKKDRILSFDSGSTHAMALMGMDTTDTGRPVKWLLENSWGEEKGRGGFLIMTDEWFDAYGFRLVVRKDFVSPAIVSMFSEKPEILKPWDRMALPMMDE